MLKTPICSFDAKTGILCPKCQSKLRSGHLTQSDVDYSVKLVKISDSMPALDGMNLLRAIDVDGDALLVLNAGDVVKLRRTDQALKRFEEAMGQKIWLVSGQATDREILEDLFFPVKILTVNTVFLPDSSKMIKAIISGRRPEELSLNLERIVRIARMVRGIELIVEFEKP